MMRWIPTAIAAARARTLLVTDPPALFSWLFEQQWYRESLVEWSRWSVDAHTQRIIELGCGPGHLSVELARQGYEVVGIDRSQRMVRAAERIRNAHASTASFLCSSEIPGKADLVLAASLINVVPDPVQTLRQMRESTRPGGSVSFLVPTPALREASRVAARLDGAGAALLSLWSSAARTLTVEECIGLASSADLHDIQTQRFFEGMLVGVRGRT